MDLSPSPEESGFESAEPGFDYRMFLHQLLAKSWILVLCLVVGLILGFTYLYRTAKLYQSRLTLEVDMQEQRIAPVEGINPQNLASLDQLRTIEQNLRNRSLMDEVVRADDLMHNPNFLPPSEDGRPYAPETLAGVLTNMVNPVIRRGTRLIDVFVVHTDPKVAQSVANSVGREYIRQSIRKRTGGARVALDFLKEQAEGLRAKVAQDEQKLQTYRETQGTTSLDQNENIVSAKLKELNSRVTQAKGDRMRIEGDFEKIERFKDDPAQLLTIPSIANHPTVVEIRNQITTLNATIANLAQRYKDKHPRMIQARSQLAELNRAQREAVLRLPPLLKSDYNNLVDNEKNLEAALADQEKASLHLNQEEIPYKELQRDLDADNALYQSVLKRGNETDLTKDIQADPVQIVESATFSPVPISPVPSRAILLAVVGGLGTGVSIVALLYFLDRTIKTVDQAEHYLELPVLAAVPDMNFPAQKGYLLMQRDPSSTAAEAFRTLRAGLSLLGPEDERKVLLFTSAVPSEGKSFCSTNYAVSLAQQGYRTLLIDADLRRPSIHKIFEMERALPGVTDCLVGRIALQKAAQPCEVENLYVLAGGTRAPNPAELLSSQSFANLVEEATRSFDRVVIDSAPVLAVSDTLIITPHIQSLCLVVRSGKTPRNAVQRAVNMLSSMGNRPVGLTLNRLPRKRGIGYYYYYSEHGYGSGVYGAEPAVSGKKR